MSETPAPDEQAIMVYVTASNEPEARKIGEELVAERLVACANVIGSVTSVFWWEGDAQHEREAAVVMKTRSGRLDAVTERVKALHSYTCPCVVAFPVVGGNPEFIEWILSETA